MTLLFAFPSAAAAELPTGRHVLLGHSARGKPIRAVRVGDPASPRKALVVAAIHGDEPAGLKVTRALRALPVRGADVWVVDTVNPDGLARRRRQNAHGVDLNRNFPFDWRRSLRGSRYWSGPAALSERESRVVRRWVLRIRPTVSVWYHQPWNLVLAPCHGPAPVQRRYARRTHMRVSCRGHELHGTAVEWENRVLPGSAAFVVELPPGPVTDATARLHARTVAAAVAG